MQGSLTIDCSDCMIPTSTLRVSMCIFWNLLLPFKHFELPNQFIHFNPPRTQSTKPPKSTLCSSVQCMMSLEEAHRKGSFFMEIRCCVGQDVASLCMLLPAICLDKSQMHTLAFCFFLRYLSRIISKYDMHTPPFFDVPRVYLGGFLLPGWQKHEYEIRIFPSKHFRW